MSKNGSDRFKFRRDVVTFDDRQSSNPGSIHSTYDPNATVSYEPGTGADFMRQLGNWHDRDAYGNPLPSTRYTPAATNQERTAQFDSSKSRENMSYIIPIAVLSALLLLFILAIVILFLTGVFQFRKSTPTQPTDSKPDFTSRPMQDHRVNRTFECEFFILDQANNAYNDPTSPEYDQASLIIRNALNTLISQSTIRDLTPSLAVERLQNQGNDLRVPFRITLIVLGSSRLTAESIQNVLLSELSLLELQLNNTIVDRSRVHVRMIE